MLDQAMWGPPLAQVFQHGLWEGKTCAFLPQKVDKQKTRDEGPRQVEILPKCMNGHLSYNKWQSAISRF